MAAQHYVSKFHLGEFCDPSSVATPDPWLWVGDLSDGSVRRRSPKNVGTVPDLFAGPGGLATANATIENFLANEVEGPASSALREVCGAGAKMQGSLPAPLMRYLAWAAVMSALLKLTKVRARSAISPVFYHWRVGAKCAVAIAAITRSGRAVKVERQVHREPKGNLEGPRLAQGTENGARHHEHTKRGPVKAGRGRLRLVDWVAGKCVARRERDAIAARQLRRRARSPRPARCLSGATGRARGSCRIFVIDRVT